MQKLILTSVLLVTFILPSAVAARSSEDRYPDVLGPFVAFVAVWVFLLLVVYPRLF